MKITPFFRWYDMYVGLYVDSKNKAAYLVFFGFGLKISWAKPSRPMEIRSPDGTELWATVDHQPAFKPIEGTYDYECVAENLHIEFKHPDASFAIRFYKGPTPKDCHLYTGKVSVGKPHLHEGRALYFEARYSGMIFDLGREHDSSFLDRDIHDDLARSGQREAQLILRILE